MNVDAPSPGIRLLSREVQQDPFPIYRRLREEFPVCRIDEGFWVISRYDDVQAALRQPRVFSSAAVLKVFQPPWLGPRHQRDYSIFSQDPPVHTGNRALVNKAFVGRVINGMEPGLRRLARRLVHDIPLGEPFDFLRVVAAPYAGSVIAMVTGTEGVLSPQALLDWLELSQVQTPERPSDEHIARLTRALDNQHDSIARAVASRRASPRDDLVTEIIRAEIDGERLDDATIISLFELLLAAGFDTTMHTLCHCMIRLAREPHLLALLQSSPDLIPAFLEEVLRHDPPTHGLLRQTLAPVEIGSFRLPAEALVILLLGSANRDPDRFDEPDRFIIARVNIREHLAFGNGPHACIGAALARLELRVMLEELLPSIGIVECPPDRDLDWVSSINTHGCSALPLTIRSR